MQGKELVVRGEKAFFRRSIDRSLESLLSKDALSDADYNRLRTLLGFAEGAQRGYGASFEEVVASVRHAMRELPPPLPRHRRLYLITSSDLEQIKLDLAVKGKIGRWRIANSQLVICDGKRLRQIMI